ncbi:aminotransferase class V-fold PLP-dependent enzyme [Haloglycomyces albus]|uniref:aminotransferase class V-fold PLP-dependent enzyme n=1 Tax=Haloglycomyces albus TaxID=526067 RepID=UPI00046D36A0|nr:aminotransferase class V-fold PLP-dependent enzyme [Haloglycomyces albus]
MVVHLNNAGAGIMPEPVRQAMVTYLDAESEFGSYEIEARSGDHLDGTLYQAVAELLNAPVDDVAVFDSATRGWLNVVTAMEFRPGDRVWVTPYEYAGNLILLSRLREKWGFSIEVVPVGEDGELDQEWMAASIDDDVALVALSHVPSGCGIVNPVAAIGEILKNHRCFYIVDGCQAVGQIPIDIGAMHCDLYTGAGRKFLRGPRGSGFSYTSPRLRDSLYTPFLDLHVAHINDGRYNVEVRTASARQWEMSERSNAISMGLEAAVRYHRQHSHLAYDHHAATQLRGHLSDSDRFELIDPGMEKSNIVTIRHRHCSADAAVSRLREQGFNAWVMHGRDTPIYMNDHGVDEAIRVSPHYYNTATDIKSFFDALVAL